MSRQVEHQPKHIITISLVVAGIILAVAATVWLVRPLGRQAAAPQEPVSHFVTDTSGPPQRKVVVALQSSEPKTSESATELSVTLVEGTIPEGATTAIVLTDTNCEADAEGISHCLNELDFGTTKVTVQHHHAMHHVPCLTPGEKVRVQLAA